jgi:hypothetical protein
MNENDIISLFGFALIWVLPLFWMFFFYSKTIKLDRFAKIAMPIIMIWLVLIYLSKYFIPIINDAYVRYPMLTLNSFYIELGFMFAIYLMLFRKWHFPQAISISGLIVAIGSFYWQAPYLISNAFITGFQLDWILHITGLMFLWYIAKTTKWKTDKWTLLMVALGFAITIMFILGWYIPPTIRANEVVWNSAYYMFDRAICTIIAFLAIKKDAPVWRKVKVDNIQNTP